MNTKNDIFSSTQYMHKQELLAQFLAIAKDYIDVQPIEYIKRTLFCEKCALELKKEDDYLFVCSTCGFSIKQFASAISYQENNRINISQRYIYDKRAHFGDSIKKFQATQNTTIPETVYRDLYEKIHNHNIAVARLTKDHIYEFLKLTKHSEHYEDINLIFKEITKKESPNITHLEQELYDLFDQIDPIYESIRPLDRVNFLNGQYVLFKLLQKLKFPCKEQDFYILKTREKMLEHDQIWKKICEKLGWEYISTV